MKDGRIIDLYKNQLDKACFQHDAAYNKYKDLKNGTQSDVVLKNKAYKIAVDPKYNGYERALASMAWKFFNERSKNMIGSGIESKQLTKELHKPIIRNFKKEKCILVIKTIFGVSI